MTGATQTCVHVCMYAYPFHLRDAALNGVDTVPRHSRPGRLTRASTDGEDGVQATEGEVVLTGTAERAFDGNR